MIETVFENAFIIMQFDATNNFMETIWTTKIDMGQDTYRKLGLIYLEKLQTYRPKNLLIDSRKAEYIIAPKDQDWINENVYPQTLEAGICKIAFLVGKDLFLTLSLEQTAEDSQKQESIKQKMQQKFFEDYDMAVKWLLVNENN